MKGANYQHLTASTYVGLCLCVGKTSLYSFLIHEIHSQMDSSTHTYMSYDMMKGLSVLTKTFAKNPSHLPLKCFFRLELSMSSLGMPLNFDRSRIRGFFSVKFILLFSTVTPKAETHS